MNNYRAILAANHNRNGKWCTCGEIFDDCFIAAVILPAMTITREKQYAELFGP